MLGFQIRSFQKSDTKQLLDLISAHAEYEGFRELNEINLKKLPEILTDKNHPCRCLVLTRGTQLFGYATFITQFSTWGTEDYLYLDCLFLKTDARGMGWGKKMFVKVCAFAQSRNINEIQWQTPANNHSAIRFYNQLEVIAKSKVRFTRKIFNPSSE